MGGAASIEHLQRRLDDLAELGGQEKVVGMLDRFAAQLELFVTDSANDWQAADIHRMIGLAAMLGFSNVEAAWRVVESGKFRRIEILAAQEAAEAAITFARRWPRSIFE